MVRLPPFFKPLFLVQPYGFAYAWCQQLPRLALGVGVYAVQGGGPRMFGKSVFGMVVGQYTAGMEFVDGSGQLFGQGVDILPVLVVLSVLHNGQIYIGILLSETLETSVVSAVSRHQNSPPPIQQIAGPEGLSAFK